MTSATGLQCRSDRVSNRPELRPHWSDTYPTTRPPFREHQPCLNRLRMLLTQEPFTHPTLARSHESVGMVRRLNSQHIMSSQPSFSEVPKGPLDPINILKRQYDEDTTPSKVDLGVGVLRDEKGRCYEIPVIQEVSIESFVGFTVG